MYVRDFGKSLEFPSFDLSLSTPDFGSGDEHPASPQVDFPTLAKAKQEFLFPIFSRTEMGFSAQHQNL